MLNEYVSVNSGRAEYEVADILRAHLAEYRERYPLTAEQARVCGSLLACRTAELGGHIDKCQECGAFEISYNSCRDRHCPKCGKYKKAQWVVKQEVVLLPIPYFHLVFTIDHLINPLVRANQRLIFNLLFEAATKMLKAYARRYLGGEIGITAVLHTWGQTLNQHLHLHCIVTGGALADDGQSWQPCLGRFLFPIIELSAEYRDYFCAKLGQYLAADKVVLTGQQTVAEVEGWLEQMGAKKWEVYANYFDGPQKVYDYLSRYVHQVAISNYRIVDFSDGKVRFSYHDNHDKDPLTKLGKAKEMTLDAVEFIRRFVWHILPDRFIRIRHYGLHHASAQESKLPRARALFGLEAALPAKRELDLQEWLETFIPPEELNRCPYCQAQDTMAKYRTFSQPSGLRAFLIGLLGLRGCRRVPL